MTLLRIAIAPGTRLEDDPGFIIVGANAFIEDETEQANIWLLKTDAAGNQVWNKTFNKYVMDIGLSVDQTTDGGYVMTGYVTSSGLENADLWVIRTNADGVEQWNTTIGGTGADYGYSVQQTTDRGFILVGYTDSYGAGLSDAWLIKLGAENNQPPFPPSIIVEVRGKIKNDYYYTFVTTDPNEDDYEPASAASVAEVRKVVESGIIDPSGCIVCVVTGPLLKDPETVIRQCESPTEIDADLPSLLSALQRC